MPKHYISLDAAAEQIGVSKRTIRRLVADGRLPAYRVGSRVVRIDSADLDALLTPIPNAMSAGGRDAA
jgi:excisionase family DNA binding protein